MKRKRRTGHPMLPGDWPKQTRGSSPPRRLDPPPPSRNPFPKLVNPLAGEWELITMNTIDRCDDPSEVDPSLLLWARRVFYLGAQAALYVETQGANRWHVRAEITASCIATMTSGCRSVHRDGSFVTE